MQPLARAMQTAEGSEGGCTHQSLVCACLQTEMAGWIEQPLPPPFLSVCSFLLPTQNCIFSASTKQISEAWTFHAGKEGCPSLSTFMSPSGSVCKLRGAGCLGSDRDHHCRSSHHLRGADSGLLLQQRQEGESEC